MSRGGQSRPSKKRCWGMFVMYSEGQIAVLAKWGNAAAVNAITGLSQRRSVRLVAQSFMGSAKLPGGDHDADDSGGPGRREAQCRS